MGGKRCAASATHRNDYWVALDRNWLRMSADDPGHPTPGHHTLYCTVCNRAWRTTAKYALTLPTGVSGGWTEANQLQVVAHRPLLAELTYLTERDSLVNRNRHHALLFGVAMSFSVSGKISPKQANAVTWIITHLIDDANVEQANRAAQEAMGERLAPDGYAEVRGQVLRAWWRENEPGSGPTAKFELLADGGFTVECTVPKVLVRSCDHQVERLIGKHIELHAVFRRHRSKWSFAWGSYPRRTSHLI